jgi:photosystem II stability/assembly factor-like uncharacterized protein
MMRQVCWAIIFLLGASVGATAEPDAKWVKLSTVPYTLNNKQDAITFADAQRGWYGNGTGRIYRTDDAGAHWKQIWEKRGTYVRALDFADANLGFLGNIGSDYYPDVHDNQPLYISHDGGDHWSPIAPQDGKQIRGVCAIDILKVDGKVLAIRAGGRVGGPAGMLESFDEGRTWRARDMRGVTGMILDIKFVDAKTGFVAGSTEPGEDKAHARILKTTDGGETWRTVFESSRANDNNWKLAFPSTLVGYATIMSYQAPENEARGYVVKTTDGGEHWQKSVVTLDKEWVPYGIAFVDEKHGFVGGSTGGYETRDGGQTWAAVSMGLSVNRMRFVTRSDGGKTAYAIGQEVFKLDMPAE